MQKPYIAINEHTMIAIYAKGLAVESNLSDFIAFFHYAGAQTLKTPYLRSGLAAVAST